MTALGPYFVLIVYVCFSTWREWKSESVCIKRAGVRYKMKAHWRFKAASTSACIWLSITVTHSPLRQFCPAPGRKK